MTDNLTNEEIINSIIAKALPTLVDIISNTVSSSGVATIIWYDCETQESQLQWEAKRLPSETSLHSQSEFLENLIFSLQAQIEDLTKLKNHKIHTEKESSKGNA